MYQRPFFQLLTQQALSMACTILQVREKERERKIDYGTISTLSMLAHLSEGIAASQRLTSAYT